MNMLTLTLKKKWFDMIASGDKREEYRDLKPFYFSRFNPTGNLIDPCRDIYMIEFRNGYKPNCPTMQVQCLGVDVGLGKEEWGAERDKEYYVIKLGKILSIKNY